jgi:hypothetical protein
MFIAAAVTSAQSIMSQQRDMAAREASMNQRPIEETFKEIMERVKKADEDSESVQPGELAVMINGTTAMKSALDHGDPEAICSLVKIDELTLLAPCHNVSTPIAYLRENESHPHRAVLVPILEGLLLERGYVPFLNGCAVPVDKVMYCISEGRSEDGLRKMLRDGEIDFKQFKTMRDLLSLPIGIEKQDKALITLIECALHKYNPDVFHSKGEEDESGVCVIS